MTIRERSIGDVTVIEIDGRMTIEDGAGAFRETAQRLIRLDRWRLVLNLHDVPYIDSMALGEIVHAYTSVTRRGGALKLLQVPARVHQLLVMTRLVRVFELFDVEADALGSFTAIEPR